jgi:hypothetical protein
LIPAPKSGIKSSGQVNALLSISHSKMEPKINSQPSGRVGHHHQACSDSLSYVMGFNPAPGLKLLDINPRGLSRASGQDCPAGLHHAGRV